ncbi:HEPN domain-containing protein [Halonotius terrestris]|uniref:HEPN domain-containing protein n=1 Tax=Halonotius terrestris TaxID=2487750 RepID=A0A8J8P9P9_9EURY|nr:HEPN domain-containing protein [Halonotius terrestris]TQQ81326.1 HEPN domain-containing protein [Halonotius terrestris]
MADNGVDEQVRQARQALDDARGAHEASLSDAVVVNRCYYACFHAAQAILYQHGHEPTSHSGVLSLFGSEIVVDGDISREHGRFLNALSTLRKQADYGYEPIEEDIETLLDQTASFVETTVQLIE